MIAGLSFQMSGQNDLAIKSFKKCIMLVHHGIVTEFGRRAVLSSLCSLRMMLPYVGVAQIVQSAITKAKKENQRGERIELVYTIDCLMRALTAKNDMCVQMHLNCTDHRTHPLRTAPIELEQELIKSPFGVYGMGLTEYYHALMAQRLYQYPADNKALRKLALKHESLAILYRLKSTVMQNWLPSYTPWPSSCLRGHYELLYKARIKATKHSERDAINELCCESFGLIMRIPYAIGAASPEEVVGKRIPVCDEQGGLRFTSINAIVRWTRMCLEQSTTAICSGTTCWQTF
eukprot:TRINITY_DN2804_c0_g1_i1.p1 TRINITY_DN2804_c0_g1~~TRINITY_DN2804_c0_g1_i1.p1  ORF type:complete len:290 (+),score=65.40 TRINITY_DN2804_c0_g1_i1:570-1439(+)